MKFPNLFGFRTSGKDRPELQRVVILGTGTMGKQIGVPRFKTKQD